MTEHLKINLKAIIRSLACVSAVILFGGVASATIASSPCVALSGSTDLTGNIQCPTFDNTLGVLTSIELDFSGGTTSTITITNNASTSQIITVDISTIFNLGVLGGFTSGPLFTSPLTTGPQSVPANSTTSPLLETSGTQTNNLTDNTVFIPYEGNGITTFDVPITTLTSQGSTGGGGNSVVTTLTNGSINASVFYTYTAATTDTPEPTTLGLIGGGLVGIGLISRRKRANKTA